jgi:hypothetical protein
MTFIDSRPDFASAERLLPQRPQIVIGVRLVDNGALLWIGGSNLAAETFKAPPERVATTLDQAVEQFRELLSQVWPKR